MNGLPLLSGRPPNPPDINEDNCRRCNKDFHFFTRTKKCNHCGYLYCSSCADFQALLPRAGPGVGYEPVSICAYCTDMLSITSSGKNKLRSLPISRLRGYMKAYNIHIPDAAVEKDDLVEAILRSKNSNGCLYPIFEDYYRRNSVPQGSSDRSRAKNFFSRSSREADSSPQSPYTPRQSDNNYQTQQTFNSTFSSASSYPSTSSSAPNYQSSSPTFQNPYSQSSAQTNQTNYNAQNHNTHDTNRNVYTAASRPNLYSNSSPPLQTQPRRARSATSSAPSSSSAPAPSPRPPLQIPTLDELLEKEENEIMHLPISTLKTILFNNRVNISIGVLEKEDLVQKVIALVADERRDREVKRREELEEEARIMEQIHFENHEEHRSHMPAGDEEGEIQEESPRHISSDNANTSKQHKSHMEDIFISHEGLCVVCQDEHANMAIIDCGHLALCKSCSELIMQTSRECPLCRTRIVTEQRLLRIFRS